MQGIWRRLGMLKWHVEQKSLAFQIPVQWFIPSPTPNIFLVLEPHCFPNDCRVAGSALPTFAFMCVSPQNLTKSFTFSGGCLSVYCRIIPFPLPIMKLHFQNQTCPKERHAAVSLVSLQDPSSAGKCTMCIYVPKSHNFKTSHFFFLLICTTVAVPAKIRDPLEQGNDQV